MVTIQHNQSIHLILHIYIYYLQNLYHLTNVIFFAIKQDLGLEPPTIMAICVRDKFFIEITKKKNWHSIIFQACVNFLLFKKIVYLTLKA